MVNVPAAAYFATVKTADPGQGLYLVVQVGPGLVPTGVPEIVQLVSVGSNPASVTVISVPGIA